VKTITHSQTTFVVKILLKSVFVITSSPIHIEHDKITEQIEEDSKNLYPNNAMIKEIILERSQSE